jgi:hypothetical protein
VVARVRGRTVRVPDAKGLHDLAALLAAPGRPVHVSRLIAPGLSPSPAPTPVLDERARAAYKARLAELDDDIDDAVTANDAERAGRARAEREFLVAELAAATGWATGRAGWATRRTRPARRYRRASAIRSTASARPP